MNNFTRTKIPEHHVNKYGDTMIQVVEHIRA